MPTFRYKAIAESSMETIEAADTASAVRELLRRGVTPTQIEPVDERGKSSIVAAVGSGGRGIVHRRTMSRGAFASFVRELSTALEAGLPLVTALQTMRKARGSTGSGLLDTLRMEVEQGKSLAEAARAWGKPFDELTISMLRAGEASGKLDETLAQAADLLHSEMKLRRSVLAATLYPAMLLCGIVLSVIFFVAVIAPRILEAVDGQIAQMPMPTRVVQGLANVFETYWWAIALAVVLIVLVWQKLYATPSFRLQFDRLLLRIPLLGTLLRDVAVARFTRTLGTLTAAGLPALTSLRLTSGTLGNRAMEDAVDRICEQVQAGRTIAEPMDQCGLFPPMLVQVVGLGERTGKLDQTLSQAANALEERTKASLGLLTTALPPVLIVAMAMVVAFVILAVMLPLLEMQEAIQ